MKPIGNYKSWINPIWIQYMKENEGHSHPRIDSSEYGSGNQDTLKKIKRFEKTVLWHNFEPDNFPFQVKIPLESSGHIDWWFVKMMQGDLIPFHSDHPPRNGCEGKKVRRFWMPLIDYVEGHIFIVNGEFIKDYIAGDLFEYGPDDRHCALNINMDSTRYTLNFAMYE